ncbi:hypothetical protein E1263_36230 [Kribbella antibiotica]|uniref:Uncharacterized protein n=1 Tax=Kribbella antibiotica TaxID=190195 RepID=A0A4R4YSL0_9ACTN|nr:hypothetical protein [Kribbella antibiotica]TDD46562.1 hypothetical protein E1263_36230 [Kribbella antibiotica]
MTIAWLQLVGGSRWTTAGSAFSGAAEARARTALQRIEAEVLASYDGACWLAQQGYERVALHLEYRSDAKGRPGRSIRAIGRLLNPNYSVAWPELETASVDEMREHLHPIVLDALAFVGERTNLGKLPKAGEAEDLETVPLIPLIDDPMPYDEEPGDSCVITRDFPPGTEESQVPGLLRQYDKDLQDVLSDEALDNILDIETSSSGVRWVIRVAPDEE